MYEFTNKEETTKNIPSHIAYNDRKRNIIPGVKKTQIYTPVNNGPFNQSNNTITFNVGGKGFLDPYSLYLKVKVQNLHPKIPLQLDNSAHSLISKLSIRGGSGTDFETIDDYDVIMSNINDCSKSNHERKYSEFEGFGYSYDKNALYETTNPLCVGNCEPIIQPRSMTAKDLYTTSLDRFSRNLNTNNKPYVAFNEVRNGLPTCDPIDNDSRTFLIPVWSSIFGWGLPALNYKYIPLAMFSPLEISFKLNEHAFFVPLPSSGMFPDKINIQVNGDNLRKVKIDTGSISEFVVEGEDAKVDSAKIYRFNPMEGEDIGVYDVASIRDLAKLNASAKKSWQIVSAQLVTEQMFFSSEIVNQVMNQSVFRIVTRQYKRVREITFQKTNMPANVQLTEFKGSVKFVHFIFLNQSYVRNCFQRKLFKYNMGLREYYLRLGSDEFPTIRTSGSAGNTNGEENNMPFYGLLKANSWGRQVAKPMAINPYNFALNYSPYDIITSDVYCGSKYSGYNEYVGRCIYAIPLDRFPETQGYWSGTSFRDVTPCEIYLKGPIFNSSITPEDEKFVMMIFLECDWIISFNNTTAKWEFSD